MNFPPANQAIEGLLAVGGDLSVNTLRAAYAHGCFPWFSEGEPIQWWHPDPRWLLFPERFKMHRSLYKSVKKSHWRVSFDQAFGEVVRNCALIPRYGQRDTWITADMMAAYNALHSAGLAHSVEVYQHDELVGGLYGVMLGNTFFGESMFSHTTDASKVALSHLVRHAQWWHLAFIDCQVHTEHLESLGAVAIAREQFIELLNNAKVCNSPRWSFNEQLDITHLYQRK